MKPFASFLTEKTDYRDAMKVLGLSDGFTSDELESTWKKLVRQYHPDRNPGNKAAADMVARVNDAHDVLKGRTGKTTTGGEDYATRQQRYADMDEKRKAYAQVAKDAAEEHLNLEPFVEHFTRIFEDQFYVMKRDWRGGDPTVASYEAEFSNKSRTIVLSFSLYIDYTELYRGRSLSSPDAGLSMSIMSDILVNRKKVTLTQRNYRMENEYKVLYDPEVLFPSSKLKSQSEKAAARKLSKRDVLLTFQKEIGASVEYSGNDIWVYVPVGQWTMVLYRITGFGKGFAMWGLNSIYETKKRSNKDRPDTFVSILEDEFGMHFLMNEFRRLQQSPPTSLSAAVAAVNSLLQTYKAQRG